MRCFRKDRRVPTNEELVRLLSPVFGPDFVFKPRDASDNDCYCVVDWDPTVPQSWELYAGDGSTPANEPNAHFGLELSLRHADQAHPELARQTASG